MFGGLVVTQVGIDTAAAVACHEVGSDPPRSAHQLQKQLVIRFIECEERVQVLLWEEYHVLLPDRVGMVEGKDLVVLETDRHSESTVENPVAVVITGGIGHGSLAGSALWFFQADQRTQFAPDLLRFGGIKFEEPSEMDHRVEVYQGELDPGKIIMTMNDLPGNDQFYIGLVKMNRQFTGKTRFRVKFVRESYQRPFK